MTQTKITAGMTGLNCGTSGSVQTGNGRKDNEVGMKHSVPVQSLIDHIKTAVDVDPWAKEMVDELLKEQEAIEPLFKQDEKGIFVWCCGSCGAYMYHIYDGIDKAKEYAKYCRQCGKKVKWE